jgi:hypothetical protein
MAIEAPAWVGHNPVRLTRVTSEPGRKLTSQGWLLAVSISRRAWKTSARQIAGSLAA